MVQDRAILIQCQTNSESYYDLLNGAIFNDLERLLTKISRSRRY